MGFYGNMIKLMYFNTLHIMSHDYKILIKLSTMYWKMKYNTQYF